MAKKPETKAPSSYDVLAAARSLIEEETISLKDLAGRMDMPPTSLAAMLAPGYSNMTLNRIDSLKAVVKELTGG